MDKRIGITSTIPVEVIFAAEKVPVDLNNLLISAKDPSSLISLAEMEGLPRNVCAWTKGIYEVAKANGIKTITGVAEGDCSNSRAIMERWRMDGVTVIPFSYPHDRSRDRMEREIRDFSKRLGVPLERVSHAKVELDEIRKNVHRLDELTWKDGLVSGEENHFWQVFCSDFWGDPPRFGEGIKRFLGKAQRRKKNKCGIRVGYVGVPPIVSGLYGELEELGFNVVYNEIQRQFSMPSKTDGVVEQYIAYTYPYDISARLEDIKLEIKRRNLKALIHYVQSFCHRGIEDYLVHQEVGVPVLTLECDRPGQLDERNRIRLEAFSEMLTNQ